MRQQIVRTRRRLQVADRAFAAQTFSCGHAFETVALAGILAFAAVLGGFAIAVALAVMHVVAMHLVACTDGFAGSTFRRVSGEC